MSARVRHRGPDGAGEWAGCHEGWHVSLGHRRLAIIDAKGSQQPMRTEDDALVLTYNGEVYNYPSLRARLEDRGHEFTTHGDTEVVLKQLEELGAAGLSAMNGMFALALWNNDTGELLLARDRAGVKPLYYAELSGGGLIFASELTALLEDRSLSRELSPEALAGYFFSDYVQAPRTIMKSVHKLAPGHLVSWRDGALSEPEPYWSLSDVRPRTPMRGRAELANELWERLTTAVRRQLVSDAPLGVFLSGGIDSSSVAAVAQALSARPIRTFSIGFDDLDFDESAHSRRVAAFLRTQHTEERLSEASALAAVEAAIASLDEPMADPSIVPTYLLSRLASQHVKVALGGDGGDELWAGYPTYQAHAYGRIYELIPAVVRRQLIARAVERLPTSGGYQSLEWKAKRFALRWDDDPIRRHLRWMSNLDLDDLAAAMPQARVGLFEAFEWPLFADYLNAMLALDFCTYLPGSVLTKVDRASMAHGLEARPPFLDNELVEWAFSLPSSLKLQEGTGKLLLKLAAREHLPDSIISRRKQGFAIPLARWLRGPLRDRLKDVLSASPAWKLGLLKKTTFEHWEKRHFEGREDRSRPLWALLVLDAWLRRQAAR